MLPSTPKETWLALFAGELLLRLRPELKIKAARSIALQLWPSLNHLRSQDAANVWHEEDLRS